MVDKLRAITAGFARVLFAISNTFSTFKKSQPTHFQRTRRLAKKTKKTLFSGLPHPLESFIINTLLELEERSLSGYGSPPIIVASDHDG